MSTERNMRTECWNCVHRRSVLGSAHIACARPSLAVGLTGNARGKRMGWFCYPFEFDPTWKEVLCEHCEHAADTASSGEKGAV